MGNDNVPANTAHKAANTNPGIQRKQTRARINELDTLIDGSGGLKPFLSEIEHLRTIKTRLEKEHKELQAKESEAKAAAAEASRLAEQSEKSVLKLTADQTTLNDLEKRIPDLEELKKGKRHTKAYFEKQISTARAQIALLTTDPSIEAQLAQAQADFAQATKNKEEAEKILFTLDATKKRIEKTEQQLAVLATAEKEYTPLLAQYEQERSELQRSLFEHIKEKRMQQLPPDSSGLPINPAFEGQPDFTDAAAPAHAKNAAEKKAKRAAEKNTKHAVEKAELLPTDSFDYVALLRAKEKWRNQSRFFGYKQNAGKARALARSLLGVSKDDAILAQEQQTREAFRTYVGTQTQNLNEQQRVNAIAHIYSACAHDLNTQRGGALEHFLRWMRKPSVAISKALVGGALIGTAFLMGGGALAIGAGALAASLGAVGRFAAVDGIWDRTHHFATGKKAKGEYAMAAQVFYNNGKKISKLANSVFENGSGSAQGIDDNFMKYAQNLAKGRFWKRTIALAAAVLPPFAAGWLGLGSHAPPANPSSVSPSDAVAPTGPIGPMPLPDLVAGKGEGIWHLAERAAAREISGFEHLPSGEQDIIVDAIKDKMVANPEAFGLDKGELIPRAIDNGGPWLKSGASATLPNSQVVEALKAEVPRRILDKLGLGENAPTLSLKPAAAIAKGAVATGARMPSLKTI
ncbi:hypothetical protein J4441_03425 [Candidatus Micrarchaeota archaeon]|nr:hypothetical protein [Candidatus Micrarchaeota archaeon]